VTIYEIILCVFVWWIIGSAGYAYWWTRDYDFTTGDISMAVITGILGPIAWVAGGCIHGKPKTIFHRRRTK
jgi:hypothetical protein